MSNKNTLNLKTKAQKKSKRLKALPIKRLKKLSKQLKKQKKLPKKLRMKQAERLRKEREKFNKKAKLLLNLQKISSKIPTIRRKILSLESKKSIWVNLKTTLKEVILKKSSIRFQKSIERSKWKSGKQLRMRHFIQRLCDFVTAYYFADFNMIKDKN